MANRFCRNCRHFRDFDEPAGICRRFPREEEKFREDTCGEHAFVRPSEDLLALPVDRLQISSRSRKICKNSGLRLIRDVVLAGPTRVTYYGAPDMATVSEVKDALDRLGIEW